MRDEFHVYQVFVGGLFERVTNEPLLPLQAVARAYSLTQTVGAKIGSTCRVFVTDGDDHIVWQWEYGEGINFPSREDVQAAPSPGRGDKQG